MSEFDIIYFIIAGLLFIGLMTANLSILLKEQRVHGFTLTRLDIFGNAVMSIFWLHILVFIALLSISNLIAIIVDKIKEAVEDEQSV